MGYLVCEKCGGYYELQENESINDFQSCECGGKLKYVKNLNQLNSEPNKHENISVCPFCGTENLKEDKFCGNCGKPLNATVNSEVPPKAKTKITDRFSKYQNKRNYSFLAIGIIGIAFITFLILWLPGTVFATHYNDGTISFNYPNSFFLDNNTTAGSADYNSSGYFVTAITSKNNRSAIVIYQIPLNETQNITNNNDQNLSTNTTSNKSINSGNNTTVAVNTTTMTVNNLEKMLNIFKTTGIDFNKTMKNGYTFYKIGYVRGGISGFWLGMWHQERVKVWSGLYTEFNDTIIVKEGSKYFYVIELENAVNSSGDDKTAEGNQTYKQIIDSFRII